MKKMTLLGLFCVSVLIGVIVSWSIVARAISKSVAGPPLKVKVMSERDVYIIGETVKLAFELVNEGSEPITLLSRPDVMTGYLKVWIAFDGREFNQYSNSSWGLFEGSGVKIQPGGSIKSEATILWNNKPQISRLGEGNILTDYAFPEAGVYQMKAVAAIRDRSSPGTLIKIESEPIQIRVTQPVGDDLKVWNRIKDNGAVAYFLQQGDTLTFRDLQAQKTIKEVEQLSEEYPDSYLAKRMRQTLEKFRLEDAKRKDKLEKAKVKPAN